MKHRLLALVVIGCLSFFSAFSQSNELDSLENQLSRTGADTVRINLLNQLAGIYWSKTPEKVLHNADESLALARKLNYRKGEAGSFVSYGIYYWSQGMGEKAMEAYTQALSIYEALNDQKGIAKCYSNLGLVNKEKGMYSAAMEYYFKALKMNEQSGDRRGQSNVLNSIGVLMKEQNKFDEALQYYQRSVDIIRSIDSTSYAGGLSNIGLIYKAKGDIIQATDYLDQSLRIFEALNNPRGKAICFNNLGEIYSKLQQYAQADTLFSKALVLAEKRGFNTSRLSALLGLGTVRMQTDRVGEALRFFNQAMTVASELKLRREQHLAYQGLAEASYRAANYQAGYDYQAKAFALKDSLFNEESTRKIAHVQASYESEKKQAEIELLKKEKARDQAVRNLFAVGLLGCMAIGLLVISRQRLKMRSEKVLMEKDRQILITNQALAQAELANSQINEKQLQLELEFRNKELTTHTLNIIQKNTLMEELREGIHEVLTSTSGTDRSSSIKFSRLIKLIDYSFSLDKDWDEFKMYFEQVHKDFFVRLKEQFPDLTSGELRLCALVKLNLNLKEAATILGISPESVKTARHRLRKKLNLPEEQSLTDFLISN